MRARLYRPQLGRFLSPDPLGLIDGTNRFAFVGAMPLSFRDPFGLCRKHPEECGQWRDFANAWFPHVPSGWDFYTGLHGLSGAQAVDTLRRVNNHYENDPCNTGRGSCLIDSVANGLRTVGGRIIDVVQIGASILPTTALARVGYEVGSALVDEIQGQNDGPVDLLIPVPGLQPTIARGPDSVATSVSAPWLRE